MFENTDLSDVDFDLIDSKYINHNMFTEENHQIIGSPSPFKRISKKK
jgi:hypothetical protein